jgi:hypothetical protein
MRLDRCSAVGPVRDACGAIAADGAPVRPRAVEVLVAKSVGNAARRGAQPVYIGRVCRVDAWLKQCHLITPNPTSAAAESRLLHSHILTHAPSDDVAVAMAVRRVGRGAAANVPDQRRGCREPSSPVLWFSVNEGPLVDLGRQQPGSYNIQEVRSQPIAPTHLEFAVALRPLVDLVARQQRLQGVIAEIKVCGWQIWGNRAAAV